LLGLAKQQSQATQKKINIIIVEKMGSILDKADKKS